MRITPARLDLLRAVGRGEVTWHIGVMGYPNESRRDRRRVTAQMDSFNFAGLVTLPPHQVGSHRPRAWELTDAGRAVLAEAGEQS